MSRPKHVSQFFPALFKAQDPSPRSSGSYTSNTSHSSSHYSEVFDFISLIRSWPTIVGEMLGANTLPLKINSGTLIVLTKHSIFAHELGFMSECIKSKIFQMFPQLKKHFSKIHFQVGQGALRETKEAFFPDPKKNQVQFPIPSANEHRQHRPHPFSPSYKKLKKEADFLLQDINLEDIELKELIISLYMQSKHKPS